MNENMTGQIIKGVVSGIEDYGIFVKINDQISGLVHISEVSNGYVRNIRDYAEVGDDIYVEVLELNKKDNHAKLSIKNISSKSGTRIEVRKIVETEHGFETLQKKLPQWIEENIKNNKKQINSIDK